MAKIPTRFGPRGRFWIADPSAGLRTDFRLSEKDFEGNAFIGLFSWLSSTHSSLLTVYCHLITLSALASTFGGIVNPICLAAFRLMMNSNLVGCSTGRSAGFAPFKILSTYVAARRDKSVKLVL
jgi:hypothetical protein